MYVRPMFEGTPVYVHGLILGKLDEMVTPICVVELVIAIRPR